MDLLTLILIFVVVGVVLYLVERYIPMDATIKKWLHVVVIVILLVWVASMYGLFDSLRTVRVGR